MKPRQISIFTAITLTTIVFTVMVIFLGVGLCNKYSENGTQLPNMGMPFISESNVLGNYDSGNTNTEEISMEHDPSVSKNSDVLGAEIASEFCVDTEPGVMLVDYQIPDVLPLCITEEYLDSNLNITAYSYGGYTPDDTRMQSLAIVQPKTGLGGCVEIEWVYQGSFICQDPASVCYECEVDWWTADFKLVDPIQIDSNHLPEVITLGADWATICDGVPSDNLNKWVYLGFISSWEGCHDNDQKFKLILAHKSYYSGNAPLQM
ncbi:MAG: hypothetical protein ACXAAH_16995 [Promethearchaeota archaeon]|jgi:hypothetical protein